MTFDTLTFYGDCLFGWTVSENDLFRALEDSDAGRGVVCAAKPPTYTFPEANERVGALVERRSDRLVGLVRVDPWQADAPEQAAHGFDELGLSGLFLHPWEESLRVNMPRVDDVVAVAAARTRPVFVAAGFPWLSEALQVGDLARRFPDTPFVLTTGGQINISGLGQANAELAVERNENVRLQTTGVYREDFIEGIATRFGPERLLYASGYPQFDPRLERRRVEWAPGLDDLAKDLILRGNAEALFAHYR